VSPSLGLAIKKWQMTLRRGTGMRVHKMSAALVGLCLVLGLSACGQGVGDDEKSIEATSASTAQTTITVALAQAPTSLDPADHRNRSSETVIRNMFDGLVTRDYRSGIHLELAEEMRWRDDRTLEISLRRGVLFHDGVEMTAEDVVFTFNRIIQENAIEYPTPHTSPRRGLITPLEAVEQVDDYNVIFHFSDPWPAAMQMLVHQQIVPKHYLEQVGTQGFIAQPIGTGPFRFVSADETLREIVLERFDEYYGGAPSIPPVGAACVDGVVFRVVPDALTRAAALRAGEVDIIQSVRLDLVDALAERQDIVVKTAPGTLPIWMEMNVNKPFFADVRVRQAINYAVDKQRIIDRIFDGKAVALPGPLSPYNNFVNQDLDPYPYDPELTRTLLEQAGWMIPTTISTNDEVDIQAPNERTASIISVTIDTLDEWRPLAEEVAEQLRESGIDAHVRTWEREVIRPQLLAGERVAYLDGWGDSAFDPVGHFEAKWHGFLEAMPYGRANYSGYNNASVNELIRRGESTADPIERHDIYDEAQKIVYDEAPALFLVLPEQIEAASSRIQNWEPASDGRVNLHDVCVMP
jgi:peptide/nickel transport system substrate-binding protein